MRTDDFSFDGYRELLEICARSRASLTFGDLRACRSSGAFVLLRHDIDMSPESAAAIAEIEASAGVRATYFFLFSSPWYDLLDDRTIEIPRRIAEMGHEIGLHYDVSVLEKTGEGGALGLLMLESRVLSHLCGTKVRAIAMHNPSLGGTDPFRKNTEFVNAYDGDLLEGVAYFSDSCGAWRDDFVRCLEEERFPAQMQLLTHPALWNEAPLTRWETLDAFEQEHHLRVSSRIDAVREMWSQHAAVLQHDRRRLRST